MPANLLALIILLSIGCASTSVQQPEPIAEPLEPPQCPAGEFRGIGADEASALSDLARQINSSVSVTIKRTIDKRDNDGKEDLTIVYEDAMLMKSFLPNAHDAYILYNKHSNVAVCMSKANAARGFLERQRLVADSLEMVSGDMLGTEHPRHKNEAWRRTQMLYGNFLRIRYLLDGWGVESPYRAEEIYSRAREGYKGYCQNAKLHWNPERETPYSEMAFSKFSGNVKMEKSPCNDRGISLAYKGAEPECSVKFGLNTCSYAHSLSVDACDGTEYLQLKNEATGAHQKHEYALEKLHSNLKSAEFWDQWMQEIKQWSPQCE